MSIETLKGLYLLESLPAPIPDTVSQYLKNNLATGTGPYGSFTVMDFLGTAAGANVTDLMLQVPSLINAMDVSVLQGIYNDMKITVSGGYGPNTGPIVIPNGPAAGTYASGDLAFTTGLIPAAQAEINRLIAEYPNQTSNLNNAFDTISAQIYREAVNQAKAGISYDTLPSSSQTSALSFAVSLTQYGQDNTPKNSAEFLNTVAKFNTLPGQAIIGAMREGRNSQSLNRAGIQSSNLAVPQTYPGATAGYTSAVLTPLPPVQPPIIPPPPVVQVPANSTSASYTVDEAIQEVKLAAQPVTSALVSTPPPVTPGPLPTPPVSPPPPPPPTPPSYYYPRLAFNPPSPPPEGPNVRLFRSSSRVSAGEMCIIDAEVFFPVMNSYPIGTEVPYTVTGVYVSDSVTPVDPSLITVSSTEGFAGRTVGYGLTALPVGLPLNGTFRITATRTGSFGVCASTRLPQDAIITVTVAGTTTYIGVLAKDIVVPEPTMDIIAVYPQVTVNGIAQPGEATTSIEVAKNFYVRARARPSTASIRGNVVVAQGSASTKVPISYTDYSSSQQGDIWLVPGSTIPTTGPTVVTMVASTYVGDFSGSINLEVIPPRYPKSIFVTLSGWVVGSNEKVTQTVAPGNRFNIVVTGEPNTAFSWSGFNTTGTTATDSNGICVFPNLVAPPLSPFAANAFAFALGGGRDTYPLTATWPDGTVTKYTLTVSAY